MFVSAIAELPPQKDVPIGGCDGFIPYKPTADLIAAGNVPPPPPPPHSPLLPVFGHHTARRMHGFSHSHSHSPRAAFISLGWRCRFPAWNCYRGSACERIACR